MAFEDIAQVMQGGQIDTGAIGRGLVDTAGFFGKIIFYFAIVFMIGFFVYYFLFRFNIRVSIKKYGARGKLVDIKKDVARVVVDKQGKKKLSLFKMRKTTPLPNLTYRQKIGKYDYYEFVEDDNGELYPCETDFQYVIGEHEMEVKPKKGAFGKFIAENDEDKEVIARLEAEYGVKIKLEKNKLEKVKLRQEMNKAIEEALTKTVMVRDGKAIVKAIPQERIAWLLQESQIIEEKIKKKDEMWDRVKFLAPYFGIVIMFLIAFFGFKYLSEGMSSVGSALSAVSNNCLGR